MPENEEILQQWQGDSISIPNICHWRFIEMNLNWIQDIFPIHTFCICLISWAIKSYIYCNGIFFFSFTVFNHMSLSLSHCKFVHLSMKHYFLERVTHIWWTKRNETNENEFKQVKYFIPNPKWNVQWKWKLKEWWRWRRRQKSSHHCGERISIEVRSRKIIKLVFQNK